MQSLLSRGWGSGTPGRRRRNSPAQKCGLREGDIIIGFDKKNISGIDQLQKGLTEKLVGVESCIEIIRHTEKLTLNITPEEFAAKNK